MIRFTAAVLTSWTIPPLVMLSRCPVALIYYGKNTYFSAACSSPATFQPSFGTWKLCWQEICNTLCQDHMNTTDSVRYVVIVKTKYERKSTAGSAVKSTLHKPSDIDLLSGKKASLGKKAFVVKNHGKNKTKRYRNCAGKTALNT